MGADCLIVASDEAAGDSLVKDIIGSCARKDLSIEVKRIDDIAGDRAVDDGREHKVILIVADLTDAMRIYDNGLKFKVLNIGNIHHDDGGRAVTPAVILNREDDEIIEKFLCLGVSIDIRDVPASDPCKYRARGSTDA
jgi:mannose/fructose/N-acetylgalactosamine-specific phosphotransferase system component IIB